ncbi:MAG: ATP synthase F1 subunit delta [Planctomycetes bacterium]|nr:ATP synthase F1 subunit delta [Planctomycetota bacterium]
MPELDPRLPTRPAHVLEDPSARAVAKVYADAFLRAAHSVGVENALEEFQSFLDDVLDRQPRFRDILTSGIVNRDEKVAIIDRAIAPHASPFFANFLRVLARHDRLELLPFILNQSRTDYEHSQGRRRVQVTTARPLPDDLRERVRGEIAAALNFTPILEERVDPSLLGGLVIQVGDTVYDSSLSTRLKRLGEKLRQRSIHEIQSGRDRFSFAEGD